MTDVLYFLNKPHKFYNICLIYPPTLNQVLDEPKYNQYITALTMSQEELEDELLGVERDGPAPDHMPTPFEFVLANCYNSPEVTAIVMEGLKFFIHEQAVVLPEQKLIVIGSNDEINNANNINELRVINEENFFEFQNALRGAVGQDPVEPPHPNEDIRVTRIKAKARYRDKIKAKQNKGGNFSDLIVALCCMNLGLTPLNIGELSYVAINALSACYQRKEKYELDIDTLLAGGDSKKIKPKYWITNS